MMISFSEYEFVIYDANCIIYYCFKTTLLSRLGTSVVIDSPRYTDITRDLTEYLIAKKIKIRTILAVFEEGNKDTLSMAIKQRITDENLRRELGLARGEKFPEDIEYKLNKKIRQKVTKIQYENWFELDKSYIPDQILLSKIKIFFNERKVSAERKGIPSQNDMCLILYSKNTTTPLISNDSHICNFREDLEKKDYTHKIVPLKDCVKKNLI
ncbi:MAG: hypothetical protein A2042_05520 [Candidatus Schekmanbacteria bacterium GWA2_38_11]|uniref:PIN domain-containing protein n=1 Tax=Candidatus Schekmanbacteria bacterium GWA2_38_11 TaxID=1817876 RepID=A0A1F7RGQ2_9BACT|nr:MAG: hypothetical protein A2042_05520 [Candidatus Schekmanbacteria bacterium GWA2_38_11]